MYRVFLVANDPSARKEEWVNAVTVEEAGPSWEFLDSGGHVIRRIPKVDVQRFAVSADRRRRYRSTKRRTYADQPQVDLAASPVRRAVGEKAVESSSRPWSSRSSSSSYG